MYKKYVLMSFAAGALLFLLFSGAVYTLALFSKNPTHEILWINNCMTKKEAIANGIKKPKIVFAGGSATLFGVQTKTIERESGMPAVNLAVHAGLQIDYIIYRLRKSLKSGDIAVLAPEYQLYSFNGEPHEIKLGYLKAYDPDYYEKLPLKERRAYFQVVSRSGVLKALKNELIFDNKESDAGIGYNSATLNENGDETNNVSDEKTRKKLLKAKPAIQKGPLVETTALKAIKEFGIWCRDNDIRFYLAFPPTLYFKEYESRAYRDYLEKLQGYFKENAIAQIGSPEESFYDAGLFFDTAYHLNQQGAALNTMKLIDEMKKTGVLN